MSAMKHLIYRIYYEGADETYIAYIGRTNQYLNSRLRGHFFNNRMQKQLDIRGVVKIEYAELPTI